ncbi:PHP domain-containing protein [Candidatus Woesearchaeota archaeon]|nr:PHP domain-containing protein [Candidatus Woesearchaeota archaeon]
MPKKTLTTILGKADPHIHTNLSDGKDSYQSVVDYAEHQTDLNVIAITDHDSVIASLYALDYAKDKGYKINIITGTEISSREGHILGLYIEKDVPPGLSCEETVKKIHELGGIAIAAHVNLKKEEKTGHKILKNRSLTNGYIKKSGVDAVEIFNGVPSLYFRNKRSGKINEETFKLPTTAGSDAHIKESIGSCYTSFEGTTKEELKENLLAGKTTISGRVWHKKDIVSFLKFKWNTTNDKKKILHDLFEVGTLEKIVEKILKKSK